MATTGAVEAPVLPQAFALGPNVPNPFNSTTRISLTVGQDRNRSAAFVRLEIFDVRGRKVNTLVNGILPTGKHVVDWDGTDSYGKKAGSGVYFAKLTWRTSSLSKKLLLLK